MRPSREPDPCGRDEREERDRRDDEVNRRFRCYRGTGDCSLRNALVEEHRWIASVSARRFAHREEPLDDLTQVALLGVLKAVERFDPDYGSSFAAFALLTVIGELRGDVTELVYTAKVRVPEGAQILKVEEPADPLFDGDPDA